MSKIYPQQGEHDHITSDRGWTMIRDRGEPTPPEMTHLEYCKTCNDWLSTFVELARKSGFVVAFEIPEYREPGHKRAA